MNVRIDFDELSRVAVHKNILRRTAWASKLPILRLKYTNNAVANSVVANMAVGIIVSKTSHVKLFK